MTVDVVSPETLATPRIQWLLARSALYELLASCLAYPETETLERARGLAADLLDHDLISRRGLAEPLRTLARVLDEVDAERIAPVHFVLFEGSVLCSPHETEYIRDALAKASQLADIAGFYAAFGLKVSGLHMTTPDEASTELEFMSLLTRKEAYAAVRGWAEHEEVARDAERRFLETHLGRWMAAFAADLCGRADEAASLRDDEAVARWFHAVGDFLSRSVEADLAERGIHPSRLTTRYVDPDADAMVCPMAPAAVPEDDELPLGGALGIIRAPGQP